jgi:hypothetical protein
VSLRSTGTEAKIQSTVTQPGGKWVVGDLVASFAARGGLGRSGGAVGLGHLCTDSDSAS